MSSTLNCFDQESKLEHFLSDADSRFHNVIVEHGKIRIYVEWSWDIMEKLDLQADIESAFPEMREVKICIIDKDELLKESDTTRRHLERDIAWEIQQLIEKGELGANDIDHVRLRFRMWSRILRAMGINSQSTILKVSTDPDKIWAVHERLKSVAKKHGVPIRVRGTRLDQAASDEVKIEKETHSV